MIILGGTPIGNLSDASARLRETLEAVTVIASEDTRTTVNAHTGDAEFSTYFYEAAFNLADKANELMGVT